MRPILPLAVALLFLVSAAASPPGSPLTNNVFVWNTNETIGLPWYPISPDDVDQCTRGLTSGVGATPETTLLEARLATPIYLDVITVLAKKTQTDTGWYAEVGWYVQPFEGTMGAKVTLFDAHAAEQVIGTGNPAQAKGWDGYKAYLLPCDKKLVRECLTIDEPMMARLEWWSVNGTNEGPHQYLTVAFNEAAEEAS